MKLESPLAPPPSLPASSSTLSEWFTAHEKRANNKFYFVSYYTVKKHTVSNVDIITLHTLWRQETDTAKPPNYCVRSLLPFIRPCQSNQNNGLMRGGEKKSAAATANGCALLRGQKRKQLHEVILICKSITFNDLWIANKTTFYWSRSTKS